MSGLFYATNQTHSVTKAGQEVLVNKAWLGKEWEEEERPTLIQMEE